MCNNWDDVPPDQIDTQGNCLSITYLHYADLGQYWGRRIYFPANDGNAIYVNVCSVGAWQGWERIATATKPREFDLPLAEGIGNSVAYSKDQFGRVQLRGWITGATANSVIATLPEGFRPASAAHFIQAISSSNQIGIARVVIRTDGTIYVELPQDGTLASGLSLQLSFLAAS